MTKDSLSISGGGGWPRSPHHGHRERANWASDCAERVLPVFQAERPADERPARAILAARRWARGELTVSEAREAAFAAHAAAREAKDMRAKAAARAAGHAAATAHVATHAPHAASYALVAVGAARAEAERLWQSERLPV
jgi:hypothetical protein